MYRFINNPDCFKNTYGKPFLVRIVFGLVLKGSCKHIADNVCRCDNWFPHDNNLTIKYNIICDGELKPHAHIIQKSIIVDISSIQDEDFDIELIVSNLAGLTDKISWKYSGLKNDKLVQSKINA
jgi:hypothetical protein